MIFVAPFLLQVDADEPIVLLAGGHVGCIELFATERVRSLNDLKGKTVAVYAMRGATYLVLASMLAYVGLDPRTDVRWVTHPGPEAVRLLAAGRIDAFMSIPPQAQELRARKIGRLVVDTSVDRGRPGASSSGDSRRSMTTHLQTMKDVPYNQWRAYNPEDAVRFYSLRLHEIGMIKTNPQKLIAQGTDWRFLNELKMELKG